LFFIRSWLTLLAWHVTFCCSKAVKCTTVFRTSVASPWIMGLQTFIPKGHHTVSVGWLEGRTWNTISCTPSRYIYCVTLTVYTQFTNMSASRIIQSSRPRVGDPCLRWMRNKRKEKITLGSTEEHRQNKQTEYSGLLLCDAMYDCVQVPTFRSTMLPTTSVQIYYLEYYEEGSNNLLRNFGAYTPMYTLPYPRRVEYLPALLWGNQIS